MANKQTLVADAKQLRSDLAVIKRKTCRLHKNMLLNDEPLFKAFYNVLMNTRREIDCNNGLEKSQQFKDDLEEIVTRMEDIENAFKLLQKKLWKAVDIHSKANTAIDSFSAFHNGDNWAALSRSDILEFRKLLKNDLRIVKFRELNVDELKREWDEADTYRKAKDNILKVMAIQLALQATTRTSELNR